MASTLALHDQRGIDVDASESKGGHRRWNVSVSQADAAIDSRSGRRANPGFRQRSLADAPRSP